MVYSLGFQLLGSHDEALDLSQEVFLRVFRTIARFRGYAALRTWIYRIVDAGFSGIAARASCRSMNTFAIMVTLWHRLCRPHQSSHSVVRRPSAGCGVRAPNSPWNSVQRLSSGSFTECAMWKLRIRLARPQAR